MRSLLVSLIILVSFSGTIGSVQSPEPEKVKLIISTGIENFIKDLTDHGALGYRLEKSLNYGGEGAAQSFVAILRLDAPNKYEYDWISSPLTAVQMRSR